MLRYRQYQAVNIMVPLQDPRDIFFSLWYAAMCKVNIDVLEMIRLKQTKVRKSWCDYVPLFQIAVIIIHQL